MATQAKTKRHGLPKPDNRGRIRPYVGKWFDGAKIRFTVADRNTSPAEAMRRLDLIRSLYDKQCKRSGIDHWNRWTRNVAERIASGEMVTDTFLGSISEPQHMAGCVDQLQAWGIPVVVTEPEAYARGLEMNNQQIQVIIQKLVAEELCNQRNFRGVIADKVSLPVDPLVMAETSTLHEAIDAYDRYMKKYGKTDENGKLVTSVYKRSDRLRYLKNAHKDLPLWKLDLSKLTTFATHWRNRPNTEKGTKCSKLHAEDMGKTLRAFLRWLDNESSYRWSKPQGFDDINWTPIHLPQDNSQEAFQTITKPTYTPEQIAKILPHTDAFGRAMICLCVNCAFGQSEVGQWPTKKIQLNLSHPHAEKIGIKTSDEDSWIVGPRPKTQVYGEHLLWVEVAEAIRPFLDGREVLPITRTKKWWYRKNSKNPQSKFTRWWGDLIKRVQKTDPDFPHLPFGSLRDLLPDIIRNRYTGDVASLALQHGSYGEDDLLKCYANSPYRQLFEATRELHSHFKPMLDVLKSMIQ